MKWPFYLVLTWKEHARVSTQDIRNNDTISKSDFETNTILGVFDKIRLRPFFLQTCFPLGE
jgi:hypothetical protein